MAKGGRTGRHTAAEPTKRYPGYNEAGNKTEGLGEYSPMKREFIGSGERSFKYLDPETGFTVTIRANNAKEAAQLAKASGLAKKRKKR